MNSPSVTARGQLISIQWIDVSVADIKVRQQNAGGLRTSSKNRRPQLLVIKFKKLTGIPPVQPVGGGPSMPVYGPKVCSGQHRHKRPECRALKPQ
jgi:hypothetical protein